MTAVLLGYLQMSSGAVSGRRSICI